MRLVFYRESSGGHEIQASKAQSTHLLGPPHGGQRRAAGAGPESRAREGNITSTSTVQGQQQHPTVQQPLGYRKHCLYKRQWKIPQRQQVPAQRNCF